MRAKAWRTRLRQAQGWVLLLRLGGETSYPSALEGLRTGPDPTESSDPEGPPEGSECPSSGEATEPEPSRATAWDANARVVELLQILLYVAGYGNVQTLRHPRLALLLSCYDELKIDAQSPREVLATRLPLVSAFVESSWAPEACTIWGLSSLGRTLEQTSRDEAFINEGPETQGWIVAPDCSERDPDLTRPLSWLLGPR